MFRLSERQLHIIIMILALASILLFGIFGTGTLAGTAVRFNWKGMDNFSEAWVCSYETNNVDKLKQARAEGTVSENASKLVTTEIVNLPDTVKEITQGSISLSHKVPEFEEDICYLLLKTNKQPVRVYIANNVIYESSEKDNTVSSYHVVPISRDYKDMVITLEYGVTDNQAELSSIYEGSFNELLVTQIINGGIFVLYGAVLLIICLIMTVIYFCIRNSWRQKKLLCYICFETAITALLLMADSSFFAVLSGLNYALYIIKACLIILSGLMHLMVLRCFILKKRVLFLVDVGILFLGVFYISVMVLQGFSLMTFENIYLAGRIVYVLLLLIYTLIFVVAVYDYGRNEGKIALFANSLLLLCIVARIIVWILGRNDGANDGYIAIGSLLYVAMIFVAGLKRALYVIPKKAEKEIDEEEIRNQIVEQFNPNLLFASFHTLQNLIKNGSAKSVKMIYYISVYVRNNLKSMEQMGEIIPFEEELEHIIAYLQLQKTRNEEFNFAIECKVKEFRVPRHSIEPMVENAVKYGISGNDNKGNVVIRSYRRPEGYAIQVIDDGIGFDRGILTRKSPTALLNLFELLEDTCKARTEVISKEGKGTVITLILPMLENDLMEEE